MFIAVLPTTDKIWKQPECPPTDEWMKKMWYICIMEYHSAVKNKKIKKIFANGSNMYGLGRHYAK